MKVKKYIFFNVRIGRHITTWVERIYSKDIKKFDPEKEVTSEKVYFLVPYTVPDIEVCLLPSACIGLMFVLLYLFMQI
jgi:hypothetical protein